MNPAWSNDQLNIKFAFSREGNVLTINLEAANQTLADEITDFVFQGTNLSLSIPVKSRPGPNVVLSFLIQTFILAAVPKQLQQQLLPPSSQVISPGGIVTQTIRVNNPQKLQLKMKLRISYKLNGNQVNTDGVVSNFPAAAWQ